MFNCFARAKHIYVQLFCQGKTRCAYRSSGQYWAGNLWAQRLAFSSAPGQFQPLSAPLGSSLLTAFFSTLILTLGAISKVK